MLASSPNFKYMELWLHLNCVLVNPHVHFDTRGDEVLADPTKTPVFMAGLDQDWQRIMSGEVPPVAESSEGFEAIAEFMAIVDRAVAGTSYEVAST